MAAHEIRFMSFVRSLEVSAVDCFDFSNIDSLFYESFTCSFSR